MSDNYFTYVRNNNDLTVHANKFFNDESIYYHIIKSYTTEDKVELFICQNGIVSSAAYYENDGTVYEHYRSGECLNTFDSIYDWYNDYYGDSVNFDKVLNNVFIGEDLVPLWKILDVAKEEEVIQKDYNLSLDDRIDSYSVMLFTFCVLASLSFCILGTFGVSIAYFVFDS